MNDFDIVIFEGMFNTLYEVFIALLPLMFFFIIFQLFYLKVTRKQLINIFAGMFVTFLGLSFFLHGVNIAYIPIAELMGEEIAQGSNWILIVIALLLGIVATLAEPAVKVLNQEVENVTGGYIPEVILLGTLASGVGLALALSMTRLIFEIPVSYFIIPGYLIALFLMIFNSEKFVAIAYDAGGVVTGPMTATFLMTFSLGISEGLDTETTAADGFGMIALVALSPIITVQILGLIYSRKEKEVEKYIAKTETDSYYNQEGESQKNYRRDKKSRRRRRHYFNRKRNKRQRL